MSQETLAALRTYARDPRLFRHYPYPDGPVMTSDTPVQYVGILKGSSLVIYPVNDTSTVFRYTVLTDKGETDIGYNAPEGLMYIPARLFAIKGSPTPRFGVWKRVQIGASEVHFENIVPRRKKKPTVLGGIGSPPGGATGATPAAPGADGSGGDSDELEPFFLALDATPAGHGKKLENLLAGSGALIWNGSGSPPEGFLGLSIEMSDSLQYEIRFVQLCVDYGRQHVETSRIRLKQLLALAIAGKGPEWDEMFTRLKRIGLYYFELRKLKDLIAHLVYLDTIRQAGLSPAWSVKGSRRPQLSAQTKALLDKLKVDGVDKIEEKLVIEGKKYSLSEFRDFLDKLVKMVRTRAPLLGRLKWDDLDPSKSDAELTGRLRVRLQLMAMELLGSNRKAHDMLGLSIDRSRQALGSNSPFPIPVVHIPKIWETVKKSQRSELDDDELYWWAVEKMETNQKAMPFVMAAMEIFLGFFCPPVGLLLGVATSFLDDEEATFKEALSDADYDVDATLVSQAEAESARFWATAGAVLTVFGGIGDVLDTAKILGKAAKGSDEIADMAKALDEAIPESADGLKFLDEASEAAEATTDAKRLDAALDNDVKAGLEKTKKAAADAEADGVVGKEAGRMAPTDDLDSAVRGVSEKLRRMAGDDFDDLWDEWHSYARTRRAKLAEAGEGAQPIKFELWLPQKVRSARLARQAPPPKNKRARSFLQHLIRSRGALPDADTILALLGDAPKLRKRIKAMSKQSSLPGKLENWSDAERSLFRALADAGDSLDDAGVDALIRKHLLDPLDAMQAAAGGDRKLAVFMTNLPGGSELAKKSGITEALGKLLRKVEVDELQLDTVLAKELYLPFQEKLILALDAARKGEIEGVFADIASSSGKKTTKGLLARLVRGNRGHAMEMLMVGELADHIPKGSKIIVGKEFDDLAWLNSLILEHGAFNVKGGIRNLVDADLLIEFPNGKKVLIDTKWTDVADTFKKTKEEVLESMHQKMVWQIYRYERAVAEGIIDHAEFWLSHHLIEGMMDLDVLKGVARRLSGDKLRIVSGVMEDPDFVRKFADQSALGSAPSGVRPKPPATTVKPEKPLQITEASRPTSAAGTIDAGPVASIDRPLAPTSKSVMDSVRRVNDLVRVGASGSVGTASRVTRMTIRLPSVSKQADPVRINANLIAAIGDHDVLDLDLWRALPDTRIGGRSAADIAGSSLRAGERETILDALDRGTGFGLTPVIDPRPEPRSPGRFGARQIVKSSGALYLVAWRAKLTQFSEGKGHIRLYDGRGRLVLRIPNEGQSELRDGWDFFPLTPLSRLGRGNYRLVLSVARSFSAYSVDLSLAVL